MPQRGSSRDPRIADELRYHRDRLIDDYIAAGMDRAAAERRAFLEFGNVAGLEDQVRDVRGRWLSDLLQDLRYAGRTLRRAPGFASVAILSLALGIGANAAIFSVINAVILRPLPVEAPDRLVMLARVQEDGDPHWLSYPLFERFRDDLRSMSAIAAVGTRRETVVVDGDDDLVSTDLVSGSYFALLGVRPAAGRLLVPADDVQAPDSLAAVISDGYWQRRFGRDPSAIGRVITIRERTFTIVGVTPASFHGIRPDQMSDLIVPLEPMLDDEQRHTRDLNNFIVMARLEPGATLAQANAEVQTTYAGFLRLEAAEARDKDRPRILRQRAAAVAAPDGYNPFRYEYARSLIVLMGSVGLVLLLACVNLSGLLLARAAARQREIAIRLSIGAGRGRLIRQCLTETLLLATMGAGVGLSIAGPLASGLLALFLNGRETAISVAPDWRVVAFTSAAAIMACVLAGLTPALHALGVSLTPALKHVRARTSGRLGKTLVIAQFAMSMMLLVGAALFIGTFVKLRTVDRGFDTHGVLAFDVRSARPYPSDRIPAVKEALLAKLDTLPGVRSAAAAQVLPIAGGLWERSVQVEGYRFRADESDAAGFNAVSPDYFRTMDSPLLDGREFDARDTASAPRVAIVNQSFARYFFGGASPLGRHVVARNSSYEIVGVVGDAKYRDLRTAVIRTMYIPWLQREGDLQPSSFTYIVRAAAGDPRALVPIVRRALPDVDPALRLREIRPYDDLIADSIGTERAMAMLGGAFAGLAMLVAALGLFGLLAFQVTQRTNELGVRMALGAGRGTVMRLVLRDVAVMVGCGVAVGAPGAAATTGLARTLLFGLTPTDPIVFAVAAAALAATALAAGWVPARRAANIDPLVALRHE